MQERLNTQLERREIGLEGIFSGLTFKWGEHRGEAGTKCRGEGSPEQKMFWLYNFEEGMICGF